MPGSIRTIPLLATAQALLLAGCTPFHMRPESVGASTPSCALAPENAGATAATRDGGGTDEIRVALERPVVLVRTRGAEEESLRPVFRQLYQTLVRVDCEGRARPALASSWSHDSRGRRWSFELRPDARFWDGTPVDAEAVARSWAPTDAGAADVVGGTASVVDSVQVDGARALSVFLAEPTRSVATFDRPALAVMGAEGYGRWPMGSGPYRPTSSPDPRPGEIRLVAGEGSLWFGSITVSVVGTSGARGALDLGVDVLVSEDPEVLAYARALSAYVTVPMPWARTYVVAAERGPDANGEAAEAPVEALERLAQGAVRADARPARPPFWWRDGGCSVAGGAPPGAAAPAGAPARDRSARVPPVRRASASRIVYPAGDPVARSLAERLVGLAGLGSASPPWLARAVPGLATVPGPLVAAGLDPNTLQRTIREGQALAFVIPLPRAPGGPCVSASLGAGDGVVRTLLDVAPRLSVTPLLDVRSWAAVRRGMTGIAIDGEGTLVFLPPRHAS